MKTPRVVVIGAEKGGAGKSTIAIHVAAGLLHRGARVAVIDLDLRQQSLAHFFASRRTWTAASNATLPAPLEVDLGDTAKLAAADNAEALARFENGFASAHEADYVLIDTPGADTPLSRAAHAMADVIVTPMNDSFVDFDMLGTVDPVTLELKRPSLYSETVFESRKRRMAADRSSIDWVVLRNRLAPAEARNRRRLEERVQTLSRRVGFRVGAGLRDRVIYRELFPFGLTVADLSSSVRPVEVSLSHVAARQELRSLLQFLGLTGKKRAEMIWLAIGFILLGIFLGASGMRRAGRTVRNVARSAWRPGVSMLALVALVGSIVALMRQAWVPGLVLAAVFVFFSLSARARPQRPPPSPPAPPKGGMSLQDAASILGVAPDATTDEIQAAYVRLMRVVHPDHGGATGLAVQLNAARDLMLEARRKG